MLYVRFDGPARLGKVRVRLTVRDDIDRSRVPPLAGGPTPEQITAIIWGPYRFKPGIDGADHLGRTVAPFPLEVSDHTRLAMQPSRQPSWYEGNDGWSRWYSQYREARIRLWADCEVEGHKPWRLSLEVPRDGTWAQTDQLVGT
ncbi:hypothetical protein ABZ387_38765 [Streptomyces flaveolus]|uniref:hypothetical protein n=1 Tax=Streptomyces flaveolus TaxID=67297 RepID=UPI0033D5E2DB